MSDPNAVSLTAKDYAELEALLAAPQDVFGGAGMFIRRKLRSSTLVFPADIAADVVTLGSRVRYRVDGGASIEHVIVARPDQAASGPALALDCARGVALLGARVGQTLEVPRAGGGFETIHVEAVPYQPETHGDTDAPRPSGTVSQFSAFRPQRGAPPQSFDGDDDDPGPSAA
jgi:regulator of nucleoside diphosphate kinase